MNSPTEQSASRLAALFGLLALIVFFVEIHWALWYYFDIEFDAQELVAEVATGGVVGAIYGFLPELNKRFLRRKIHDTMAAPSTSRVLAAFVVLIFVIGVLFNRTKIEWPPGRADIQVDGQKLRSAKWIEPTTNATSIYGLIFQKRALQVGDYSEQVQFRPLVPLTYAIPEAAMFSSQPEYQEIVNLLALSFYQATENRFLTDASDQFGSETAKRFVDLSSILTILQLCFIGNDVARNGDKLLGLFRQQRPTSPWLPLLASCLYYARGEFEQAEAAAAAMPETSHSPLREVSVFFRGVNQLKRFIEKANASGQRDLTLLARARAMFRESADLASKSTDEYFHTIAVGSARIFEGITFVYGHDNDNAAHSFIEAAETTYPELRARALSDLGYVSLLIGKLQDAHASFNKALEADPTFPYAETNLGYVLLAENQYGAAREHFVRLVKDKELKRISMRDTILSEIAIAHIDSEKKSSPTVNPDAYNEPLKQMGIFNYEGMNPPLLRLAKIRLALADKIYMSHDYYGLEMLALAMYARAYRDARGAGSNPEAGSVAEAALNKFKAVAVTVDSRCFIFHVRDGFFKPVADLAVSAGIKR